MRGFHWGGSLRGKFVNIPYWPHRILVVAAGHCTRGGRYIWWLPCCYTLHLQFCCPAQRARTRGDT